MLTIKKVLIAMALFAQPMQAQDRVDEFGIFDHLSIGLNLGTNGVGLDLAAPVTEYLQVRAGYNFFSGFKYKEDVDYRAKGKPTRGKTEVEVSCCNVRTVPLLQQFFHKSHNMLV